MTNRFDLSARLSMPGYPFAELERKASAIRSSGKPLFDLSIGDPDLPAPEFVVDAVRNTLKTPASHRYPSSRGDRSVRQSVTKWFQGRFGVELDPDRQVAILIGAKEGLAQIARAFVNPGDTVAFPDPAYPVYGRAGCIMVDGSPRKINLTRENGFLPNPENARGARLLYLNYPNNPTGASADIAFMRSLADFIASEPQLVTVYDMAYSEMTFGTPAHSLLEFTPDCIEFHSLSKMANATGYRVGFAVGAPELIAGVVRAKEEMDSGAPLPFQMALKATLDCYNGTQPPIEILQSREVYKRRKNYLSQALSNAGYDVFPSDATFYIWFRVGEDELPFVELALEQGVLLTPGSGFGTGGKGWVRASVTAPDDAISGATDILKRI